MGSRGDNSNGYSIPTCRVEKCMSKWKWSGGGGARVEPAASSRTKVYQSIVDV